MFQTKMYVKELLDYLNTVTIKNEMLAESMFNTWVRDEYKDIIRTTHPHLHPYYRNITGDYILKDLTALEPLLGIDRSKMSILEYRQAQPQIAIEAMTKYGLSDKVYILDRPVYNKDIYHKFNDLILIGSMDTQETIPLTRKIISSLTHVKTIASYRIPNENYYTLCEQYSDSAALIKSVLYPIPNKLTQIGTIEKTAMEVALEAPNLTILNSDISLLEDNEQNSILECIHKTLSYIKTRWTVSKFSYEELYPVSHEAVIWNMLFLALNVQRIKNIKTYSAHSYHIWEYIKSHGFEDYRTVLTRQQTLFLYKNLPYLLKRKGTEKVLELLSYVLLNPWNIRLNNKLITQQTKDHYEIAQDIQDSTKPIVNIISKRVGETMFAKLKELTTGIDRITGKSKKIAAYQELLLELEELAGTDSGTMVNVTESTQYESLKTLYDKERNSQLEYQDEDSFKTSTDHQNKLFSITPHNLLKTKLLEIVSPVNSLVFETLYARFITQQILYRASTDSLKFAITFLPSVSDAFLTLTANNAIALLLYAILKEKGFTPEYPPDRARITIAYKDDYDVKQELPEIFHTGNVAQYSKAILKPVKNAYGFSVKYNYDISGIYVPATTTNEWKNINGNLISKNVLLKYNTKNKRWEFFNKTNNKVVLYSNSFKYNISNIFSAGIPWEFPQYWFNQNKERKVIDIEKVLNPEINNHYVIDNEIVTHPNNYSSVEDFSNTLHKQGENFVSMFAEAGNTSSNILANFLFSLHTINNDPSKSGLLVNDVVLLNLLNGQTYKEFFSSDPILTNVMQNISISKNPTEGYAKLSSVIIDTLYPIINPLKRDADYVVNTRYKKLKELFISMCSYNVAFLETENINATPYTMRVNAVQHNKLEFDTTYYNQLLVGTDTHSINFKPPVWNDMNSMFVSENVNVEAIIE